MDQEIGCRNSKKGGRSQVETEFSEGKSDDKMEFMCKSHMDSCGDTEGEDTRGDEYDDARDEIDDN